MIAAVGGRLRRLVMATMAAAVTSSPAQAAGEPVLVLAAGSLRAALTEVAQAFERQSACPVKSGFGASGLLKDRIERGEAVHVFASANMDHPEALRHSGRAAEVLPFARNALCALAAPAFSLADRPLPQRLLDADVRVGTSTPRADPSGDYAFEMFERIESTGAAPAGSAARLKAKALQLTGGPQSPPPPAGASVYGQLVATGQADVFITYCTNAAQARKEVPSLQVLAIADAINVSARYGLALMQGAPPEARAFVDYLRGDAGQAILARHGFSRP